MVTAKAFQAVDCKSKARFLQHRSVGQATTDHIVADMSQGDAS
jgi:hypothetical protein